MGERRRPTLGERGAQPDPIRGIAYGEPAPPQDVGSEWLEQASKPKLCCCGIELPVTGKCDYCD
jgi:hypothetical protein